jgi:anthranilate synthase component 2
VLANSIPKELIVTAVNDDGLVMGLRHVSHDVKGLQFHPESVMTTEGPKMIKNWLKVI